MNLSSKQKLGQFYTTNYNYILQSFSIPNNIKNIIEPFAGNGDLINFLDKNKYNIECYDIEPKKKYIIKRDTLINPPDYNNKYILTNPPFLARNKNKDKTIYDKYKQNDLYKCFIQIIINSNCLGGIIIVPLNFICSIRKNDIELRKQFVNKYNITKLNIFEESVFNDTKYSICSIQFIKYNNSNNITKCIIYPYKKQIDFTLTEKNNYMIGGKIYNIPINNKYNIDRATRLTKNKNCITNILLKCIDDNLNNKIRLKFINNSKNKNYSSIDKYIDYTKNLTFRSYAILVIEPQIDINKQKKLIKKFNKLLNKYRDKYNSLFLTNYRESNSIARKRISFSLSFKICNYLLNLL
jgi:hypothetical protein